MKPGFASILATLIAFAVLPHPAQSGERLAARLLAFNQDSCRGWPTTGAPAPGYATGEISVTDLRFGERVVGDRYRLPFDDGALIELDVVQRGDRPVRFVASLFDAFGDPQLLLSLDGSCNLQAARELSYDSHGQALSISSLDADLQPVGEPDWLNPPLELLPLEDEGRQPDAESASIRVALVDSGVNYEHAEINRRLARDDSGALIGFDFWEMDPLPYDSHPVNNGFFVQRHGTRTASLLLREAPEVELVPYRYPRPDMSRMHALVEHADANDVGIIGMPLGSNRAEDWGSFERAAQAHPHILFVVSAGNNGRDIDQVPVFPAALDLDNMLVVTSADDFVQPAERVNWGRQSVDYLVPAERMVALDYSGIETRVSGSSYAVSRVAALAARIKAEHPDWDAARLIEAFERRYRDSSPRVFGWVSSGYIADPLAGAPILKSPLVDFDPAIGKQSGRYRLDLDFLLLDPQWPLQRVRSALQQTYEILAQCDIVVGSIGGYGIEASDYLLDLSTGPARSLLEAAAVRRPTVVFARDTRMRDAYLGEAFGLGNTSRRPWLRNSVWLMYDVDDAGIALAHELFHVLANSGEHVVGQANLMQAFTRPESTELTPPQCALAQHNGLQNGLLHAIP